MWLGGYTNSPWHLQKCHLKSAKNTPSHLQKYQLKSFKNTPLTSPKIHLHVSKITLKSSKNTFDTKPVHLQIFLILIYFYWNKFGFKHTSTFGVCLRYVGLYIYVFDPKINLGWVFLGYLFEAKNVPKVWVFFTNTTRRIACTFSSY